MRLRIELLGLASFILAAAVSQLIANTWLSGWLAGIIIATIVANIRHDALRSRDEKKPQP